METVSYRAVRQTSAKEAGQVSRTACGTSSKVDNHRALDVGELHRGTGTFKVRKPKVPEGGPDITVREIPDELTLRAEEVNTLRAYMVSTTLHRKDGALPWLMLTGMLSARRCTRASKEKIGKICMILTRQ